VVFGTRLRYVDDQLLEVEAQIARVGALYYDPDQIIPSGPDTWLEPLSIGPRSSTQELTRVAMNYFDSAVDASLLPAHAPSCERRQNGMLMPNQGNCGMPPGTQRFEQQRYPLADETTGVVAAIVKYGDLIGMYLIKIQAGTIQDIEVVGGATSATTGW
jgi:hypothetical protein